MRGPLFRLAPATAGAILAAWCLISCTGAAEIGGDTMAEGVNAFLDEVVMSGRRSFPAGGLEARLGIPLRTTRKMVADDTLDVQQYYGLEVGVVRTSFGAQVLSVALTGPRYAAPEGLRVGYAEREVLRRLGRPLQMASGTWTYSAREASQLLVEFENQAVSRLSWRFADGGR